MAGPRPVPILEYTGEVGADLMMVGSYGHSVLGGLLIGISPTS
jgi:nucleotide-binding universal stress UspA family protein